MKPVVLLVQGIMEEFASKGLEVISIAEQADDLHRVHFRLREQDLHLAVDEQALYAFSLDLTDVLQLEEDDQPGILREALGAINRIQSKLHYVRFLLRDPNPQPISVFDLDTDSDEDDYGWLVQPLPESSAVVTLNFDIPLFGEPEAHWVDAFCVAVPTLFDGANRLAKELQAAGYSPTAPEPPAG